MLAGAGTDASPYALCRSPGVKPASGWVNSVAGALGKTSGPRWLRMVVDAYIEAIRNTPFLIQLFLIFFGLPLIGFDVSRWVAATVAMAVYGSAFLAEIWRGAVEAIPTGQWEAASSLGMTRWEQMRWVGGGQPSQALGGHLPGPG